MSDLSKIVSALKKKYATCSTGEEKSDPIDLVSTGNLAFDLILDGGIPFGYGTEFLGLSQGGKSVCILSIMKEAQKSRGALCVLVDRENSFIKSRAEKTLGIDTSNLIVVGPSDIPTPTDAFLFIKDVVEGVRKQDKDRYIVIGIDSISAFGKDTTLDKSDQGRKAKAIHEGLRECLTLLDPHIMLLVANQVTYKVGIVWGDNKTSTAGESLKYYSTIRVSLQEKRQIVDATRGNEVIGAWIEVESIKTRIGPCYRTCHVPVFYTTGIPYYGGLARLLASRNILIPKNKTEFKSFKQHTLTYKEETVNEWKIEEFLKAHPEIDISKYPEYNTENGSKEENEEE